MAAVLLIKEAEFRSRVSYRYGPDEQHLGLLDFDTAQGHAYSVEPVPGAEGEEYFFAAVMRVREHWREGSFPDRSQAEV